MQNLQLLEYLAEAFRYQVRHYQWLAVPVELLEIGFIFFYLQWLE